MLSPSVDGQNVLDNSGKIGHKELYFLAHKKSIVLFFWQDMTKTDFAIECVSQHFKQTQCSMM